MKSILIDALALAGFVLLCVAGFMTSMVAGLVITGFTCLIVSFIVALSVVTSESRKEEDSK